MMPLTRLGTTLRTSQFDDCVPLNIFGEGRASQEAVDYVTALATSTAVLEQEVISINANVGLFDLPAGEVRILRLVLNIVKSLPILQRMA